MLSASAALPMSGRDIMLVLDVSGSMEAKDFTLDGQPVRRLDAVKAVTRDFLRRRAGDRIGLVFFAENAELAAVPTFDIAAIQDVLADTEIGMLGRSTAIGDGLGLALKRLKDSSSASKVVVLLSDGANTAGIVSAQAAAQLARALGVRVHSIALGSDTAAGEGAAEQVDAAALEAIAATTGGEAFRVRTTDDLRTVTAAIDALEPARIAGSAGRHRPRTVALSGRHGAAALPRGLRHGDAADERPRHHAAAAVLAGRAAGHRPDRHRLAGARIPR